MVLLTVVAALTVLPCVTVGKVFITVLVVIGDFCIVGEASLTFASATVDFTVCGTGVRTNVVTGRI